MSDSDSDCYELANNVFNNVLNGSTTVCAKGPNITKNISWLNFRNNMSTLDVRQNFKRPRYAESAYDQRSMYSRRETSPMSLCSASGLRSRNFGPSHYQGGMSSQRSVYNQRSRSPMSVRTNVSNVSAMDIITAIDTNKYNKDEWNEIQHAFFKKLKHRQRYGIKKRRNIRKFLKGSLNRSGGESGEQGSISSVSDDDCRSVRSYRTTGYKECSSHYRSVRPNLSDFRRTMQESNMYRDCTDNLRQNFLRGMFSTAPSNVEESTLTRSQYNNSVMLQRDRFKSSFLLPSQRFNQSVASSTIPEKVNQLQRFNEDQLNMGNGKVLNRHRAENNICNNSDRDQEEIFLEMPYKSNSIQNKRGVDNADDDVRVPDRKRRKLSSSPKVNVKSKAPVPKKTSTQSKGNSKSNDFVFAKPQFPFKKLTNVNNQVNSKSQLPCKTLNLKSSHHSNDIVMPKVQQPTESLITEGLNPKSQMQKSTPPVDTHTSQSNAQSNDSIFVKAQFPLRKAGNLKNSRKVISELAHPEKSTSIPVSNAEVPIESSISKYQNTEQSNPLSESKSQQPTEIMISNSRQPLDATDYPTVQISTQYDNVRDQNKDQSETTQHNITDMSMRPSFMKRKLFTQKVDLAENKNSSSENLEQNSPQTNIYSELHKERSKTRKLVTSQSCLNRDVFGDDSNLLDLIHKIVPPDRMNLTTTTNRSEVQSNRSKPANANEWDVSRAIAACKNADDGSDTYTDEEIFKADEVKNTETKKKNNGKNDVKHNEVPAKCAVVVEKLPNNLIKLNIVNELSSPEERNVCNKRNLYNCVKSFWDTDSDIESNSESNNQSTNGKCNQKSKDISNHSKTPKDSISKKSDKENSAPISRITTSPLPPPKSARTLRRNNKKPENTKNLTIKCATSKTATLAEKNNNTVVEILPNTKSKLNTTTVKMQDNDNGSRGVKTAEKLKNNTKNALQPVQTEINKFNPKVKTKKSKTVTQKRNTPKSILNTNSVLKNVDNDNKVNNSTLSLRSTRTARIQLCCVQSSETEKSLNDTSANERSVCRILRSRVIDLSHSLQSDVDTTLNVKNKNVHAKNNNSRSKVDTLGLSDVSFTLTADKIDNKRPSRLRNNIGKMTTRRNDVSFPKTSDKPLNKTITDNMKSTVNFKTTKSRKTGMTESLKIDSSLANVNKKGQVFLNLPIHPKSVKVQAPKKGNMK